jgi:hypothetical protein
MDRIKSEKAREYIFEDTTSDKEFQNMYDLIPVHDAVKAISIAEQDAEARCRERAALAFRHTCFHRSSSGWCSISYSPTDEDVYHYDNGKSCNDYCSECGELDKFLKLYDNERD